MASQTAVKPWERGWFKRETERGNMLVINDYESTTLDGKGGNIHCMYTQEDK
jgi:hypothetical protein